MKLANVIKVESGKTCSLSYISAAAREMPKRGFWSYVRDVWSGAPVGSCGASKSQLTAQSQLTLPLRKAFQGPSAQQTPPWILSH